MTVDFPALGSPTSPTSATSLSSSLTSRSSPTSPSSAKLGACRVEEGKCALPNPPRPPSQMTNSSQALVRSQMTEPSSRSVTRVPIGTSRTRSSALAPCISCVPHFSPSCALTTFLWRNLESVFSCVVARRMISPPSPPSPPYGPHFGIYFSRRHEMMPSPHFPALRVRLTSSMNILEF